MTNRVIGPGIALPAPQVLYPANLMASGVPYTQPSNTVSLAAGQSIQIPAGDWIIDLGKYSILEIQDPVPTGGVVTQTSGYWRPLRTQRGTFPMRSDGINYRVSNLTGCAVSAVVTKGGSNWVQASTVVAPSTGNSTWQAIVGGRIQGLSLTALGAGYGVAPIVYIAPPPAPGLAATAVATLSGTTGTIASITMINQGAGYTSAPAVTILPNPFDPSTSTITAATAQVLLTGSGAVSAIICTNAGAPVASTMTLAVSGAGQSCLVTPSFLTTISAITFSAAGSGSYSAATIRTYGGVPAAVPKWTNPDYENTNFLPRQAQILATLSGGFLNSGAFTVIDGGMFLGTASPIIDVYGGVVVNAPAVTLTQGSASDTVIIQPA